MSKKMFSVKKLVMSGLLLALAFLLPFLTGQIPQVGSMLLPMHLPVLICGFVCGWPYGLAVGFIAPLLRSAIMHMPPMYPTAVAMAFELAAYGAACGLLYKLLPKKGWFVYVELVAAMIFGRLVWGLVTWGLMSIAGNEFTWQIFIASAVLNAVPGIVLQLVIVPPIVLLLKKAGYMENGRA